MQHAGPSPDTNNNQDSINNNDPVCCQSLYTDGQEHMLTAFLFWEMCRIKMIFRAAFSCRWLALPTV
jgi:hypothetical protein